MEQPRTLGEPMFSGRALAKLIVPLMIEQLLAMMVGMADTVMIASVGEAAVSGISLVDTINTLIIQLLAALTAGGAVVAAQYIGRQDRENACIAGKQLLTMAVLFFILVTGIVLATNRHLLRFIFGAIDDSVMGHASTYLFYTALSFPFLACYNCCASLFRAMGNSRVSMLASLLMNLINIVGNAILIFGLQMGTAGAGIATLVSRAIAAILMLVLIRNRANIIYLTDLRKVRIEKGMIRNILRIGIPSGIENSLFHIGKLTLQSLIASLGTVAIAANAIADTISKLQFFPGSAMNLAMITVVGQCVGAGELKQARSYSKKLLFYTFCSMAVINLPIMLFARPITELFRLQPQTTDLVCTILPMLSISHMIIWPVAFTLPNALRAAGDAKFTMTISMISMWLFRVATGYYFVLVLKLGVSGIWYAMYCDWLFRSIFFVIRFCGNKWLQKEVIS